MEKKMTPAEIDQLAGRIQTLTAERPAEPEVMRDIERLAREDLPAANALWDQNVPNAVKEQPYGRPEVLHLGKIIESQYEGATYERNGRDFMITPSRDIHIKHASAGAEYEVNVIGRTEKFLVTREIETGDVVLHKHKALVGLQAEHGEQAISIRYPHGKVGLVTEKTPQHEHQHGLQHEIQRRAAGMEIDR